MRKLLTFLIVLAAMAVMSIASRVSALTPQVRAVLMLPTSRVAA
jgi:hypothetical protein